MTAEKSKNKPEIVKHIGVGVTAEVLERIENYRWPARMSASEFVLAAILEFLDNHEVKA